VYVLMVCDGLASAVSAHTTKGGAFGAALRYMDVISKMIANNNPYGDEWGLCASADWRGEWRPFWRLGLNGCYCWIDTVELMS
jgi:hypothetical protein